MHHHYEDSHEYSDEEEEEKQNENFYQRRRYQQEPEKSKAKNELKSRLYDQGFSTKTMPSVQRPETANSNIRPLSAKLNTMKNKLGPAVYSTQPAILNPSSNFNKSRSEQKITTMQTEGENLLPQTRGTQMTQSNQKFFGSTFTDGFKKQEPQQIPIIITKGEAVDFEPQNLPSDRPQQQIRQVQSQQLLYRPTSTQSLNPLTTFQKQMALPQSQSTNRLGAIGSRPFTSQTGFGMRPISSQTAANFFGNTLQNAQTSRPPTTDYESSRKIIDNLSGKKSINPRYFNTTSFDQKGMTSELNVVPEEVEDTLNPKKKEQETLQVGGKNIIEEPPKRPPSNLDKYIELILKNVTNIDEFIYLIRNPENDDDDPYDLKVIDYSVLRKENPKEYYTISMKGLCHYVNGKPLEFISLAYWLKERETYDKIKSLSFFVKFRKWKTLKMWRRNITKYKTDTYSKALNEKLFILHPVLSETLIIHRDFCLKMESLRFINLNEQVEIQDLQEFTNNQEKQRKYINEEIQKFSKFARDNIREGFKKCLDALRKKKNTAVVDEDFTRKNENQPNMVRLKESAYENLGFPDNMSYERRSELRKECSRFIRFSYLVDFLALESLSSVFTQSINDLIDELCGLNNEIDMTVLKGEQEHVYKASKSKEPLFFVKLDFNEDDVPEDEIDQTELVRFDIGSSEEPKNPWDFDILGHLYIEEDVKGPNGEELDEEEADKIRAEIEQNRKFYQLVPRDVDKKWLQINPALETILTRILSCFHEGMNSLQAFERWSKHDELTPYARVLEEWDDMVGDDWDIPESNFLNPNSWIKVSAFNEYGKRVRELLKVSFDRADAYIHIFREFLIHYWKNKQIDYDKFANERLGMPIETMQATLALIEWQKEHFEKEIPHTADIGLLRIDSKKVRDKITPSPTIVLERLQNIMPGLMRNRLSRVNDWLTESIARLSELTINIDQYVKQTLALKEISKKFPAVKETISVIDQLYIIFKEHNIEVTKDDDQNIRKTIKNRDHLNEVIIKVEDGAERNLERFARDVKNNLIPRLNDAVNNLETKSTQEKFLTKEIDMDAAITELEGLAAEFFILEDHAKTYNRYEETLGLAVTRFENVENLKNQVVLRRDLWKSLKEWKELREKWITGKFNQIDTDEIKTKADYYTKIIARCNKVLIPNPILDELRKMVFDFKDTMPVVLALRNKYLEMQHIEEIKEKLGEDFELHDELTLYDLIEMNVVRYQKEIQEISTQATQEAILYTQIESITEKWKTVEFVLKRYKEENSNMREMYIIGEVDEIKELLDESLANLNNILGSRYLKYHKAIAQKLHKDLMQVQDVLDSWLMCQRNWIYLENIFSSPDIQKQLSNEAAQFKRIDQSFKDIMKKTASVQSVWRRTVGNPGVLELFNKHNETLNKIQKELENYLEKKREEFPRFYFLSNDELLEILANSANPQAVQPHLKKCFDNIYKLDFGEDPKSISVQAMISAEGEKVPLAKATIAKRGEVEVWLRNLQENMVETLKRLMKAGWRDLEKKDRKKWVLDHPGQIVATISQVLWTQQTKTFINMSDENPNALDDWLQMNRTQLEQLTELIKSNLPSVKHKIIVALITTDVHNRDIIEYLRDENVVSDTDFCWQKQLTYSWEDENEDHIIIRQVNAKLDYGYEYMGATSRLVITPLTDRCWMTITGALNLKLGAAPAGPAGTGKTESTKDLAKGLGMLCIVFNCSEQIDYKMMGRLFSGLAQQGAWACLDEFNRIDIEVLSVVAQQLLSIRQAHLQNAERFFFVDREINLKSTCGVFITMNPGYAGRTELPDNLKVLFRPVSMMIPNYGLIAKVMLYAEGFKNADELAEKMVTLYKLSSEQLSQQDHYDFGMRAVKSVLVMAGTLKRSPENANVSEDEILIRAMRDSNIPKFLKDDIPLFQAIVKDLFPKVEVRAVDYGELEKAVTHSIQEMKLQVVDKFVTKVIQLFETFNVRFGVMLVGQTGSGKTTCYKVLREAMTYLRKMESPDQRFQIVKDYCLNPKSISMGELFGEVHPLTKEWNDGLASCIMRAAANDETSEKKWVVFDGPVDALWIENMNTVLDDNMMLCLSNGQRIKLRAEMRMLFEVQDLAVASPATVSRCGMVYMTFEDLTWRPYVKSWLATTFTDEYLNPALKNLIWDLFQSSVDATLDKIRHNMVELIVTTDLQLVRGLTNLLEVFLSEEYGFKKDASQEQKQRYINYIFAYAFTWSIGASVSEQYHDKMNDIIRDKFQQILYPNIDSVYAFYLDTNELVFKLWAEKVPEFEYSKEKPYFEIVVPTPDTTKYSHYLEWLLHFEKPVFVTGAGGVGKSLICQSLLSRISEPRRIDAINLIFSAQTNSPVVQGSIEDKLQKYNRSTLGPRFNRRNVIFIDDINMPTKEEYGAQPPIELLRQLVDKHGFYDRKLLEWKEVKSTIILACAAPPGGGRTALTPRFVRHFHVMSLPQPSERTLSMIFTSIVNGFLSSGFQESVKRLGETMVTSTIEIYSRILKEKPPIPSKFHYTFNLRDVSKVIQGILMCKGSVIHEGEQMIRLWIHESSRVFHDRLVDNEDRVWFNKLVAELLERMFRFRFEYEDLFEKNVIYFSDILRLDSEGKEYEEVKNIGKLQKTLEDKLEDYNLESTTKMNLVFFKDCMEHIMRISRVLRQPRGSAMLVGVGGSGKQSLTKLATFLREFTLVQIEITKGFGAEQFRENIREMMLKAGVEGKNVVFLFTDTQIINETFLEDINNILNSGEVPNLWEEDQKKNIIEEVTALNQKKGRINEPDTIYRTFIEEVRSNLHIVLCMSPIGGALRDRCRKFPSLVDCCTIDWFSSWPRDALVSVSSKILAEVDLPSAEIRNGLAEMCPEVHISASEAAFKFDMELKRKVYTTPKSYLDMLNLFLKALEEKRTELKDNHRRLSSGITKLKETNETVAQLQIQLTELQPKLAEQNIKTEKALRAVEADTLKANEQQAIVEKQTEEVNIQAMEIKITTEQALSELKEVEPLLIEAENSLQKLQEKDFVELKSLNNPPKMVAVVMDAVSVILNEKGEGDWNTTRKLLNEAKNFKERLLTFNKDTITDAIINKLRKFLLMPEFVPDIIRTKSKAAELLCAWCIAMNKFKEVEKKVEPKKKHAAKMQEKLDEADKVLRTKQEELNAVQANVAKLRKELDDTIAFQKSLAEQMERCKVHLVRAEKLEVLLADEGKRWEETVKTIDVELINVVGDIFLSSAILSYQGPFTGPYRNEMLTKWMDGVKERNIPVSDNFNLVNSVGNSLQIRDWNLNGLPTDIVSQDNSLIATKGYRWPLMIDPQLQASKWIKNMEASQLKILKFSDAQFAQNMKSALMLGYPVLIQDIELTLDPSIDSVLEKQFFRDNDGRLVIKFGDAYIDYDMNFKLYMTTKFPNPNYLPEVFIKSTVINFNITFEGLEDQLLGDVVKNERPEIEAQRDENIVKLANFNKQLKNLENQILKMLAESEGNILDNVQLIDSLETSKTTAITISKELADSKILEEQIEKTRNQYIDVSIRGSILYFVIADLSLIDPMYQYSLQYIKKLFNFAMSATQRTDNLEERLGLLIDKITKTIYVNVCRGLFEAHKIIFSFLIAISIKKKAKVLDESIWSIFLRGAGIMDKEKQPENPDIKLIGKNEWDLAYYLENKFPKFKGIIDDILGGIDKWIDYANSPSIVEDPLPGLWDSKLDSFERIMFIKIFRPEKIMFSIQNYVIDELGSFFVEGLNVKMDVVYEESDKKTPIIFVLSQGADPTSQIIRLSKDKDMSTKLHPISLGQGQGDHAKAVIEKGKQEGLWVLLQNCHLARTWMPSLELLIEDLTANEHLVHEDFRIFLTSMPAAYFPVSILQNGIKLTTEAPRGLKNNLKRSYMDITDEFLDDTPKREAMHKLVFGLAFFHGVIQERKKFGPLGWNIRYEFNDSDLETSQTVLQMLLRDQEIIPWDALLFVTGDINYGGRVTDDWDRRCLISILKRYYTTEILEDKYYLTDNDIYYVPPVDTVESYRQYIETLPLTDDPEVFGMHENANIIYQTQESEKILKTILSIQPRVAGSSSGKSSDETVYELAQQILDDLPESLKKEEGNSELFKEDKDGLIPPLSTVILQEMARFNRLLIVITNSLKNLQKAIKGVVLMSTELDSMYSSLMNNQVPKLWEKAAYPSLKPLASWIKDLQQRVEFMRGWLQKGNPAGYWLSGFFFPQGFITGVLQTHARKYEVAIDKLKFSFRILDLQKENLHNPPADGVYVYGLYLEGATWDKRKKTLNDPIPGEMHFQMPAIHFNPSENYESKPQDYNCPVYKTSARAGTLSTTGHSTNFILAVDIPTTDLPPESWVLRGTALLCQLND